MIFVTGGTGFLGNAIISRILATYPQERVAVLVRAASDQQAREKLLASFSHLREFRDESSLQKSLTAVRGDLSTPGLGISIPNRTMLEESVNSIYHSAANTHLSLPYEEAHATNLDGTERVLELACRIAEKNPSLRFNHISTAYVAGDTSSVVTPDMLDLDVRFRNSYEETKAKAESMVRSHSDKFTVVVFRPSIIVGDSTTGITSSFNVLYIPARIVITGLLKVIPALPHIPFDVVPVDYVAESIASTHRLDLQSGSAFHLSAGVGRESNPAEVLDLLFRTAKNFNSIRVPQKPAFIAPEILQRALHSVSNLANNLYHTSVYRQFERIAAGHLPVFKQLLPFVPYMISNPRFETTLKHDFLEDVIKPAPLFHQYAENIFKYCLETQWGKNPSCCTI
jgi:thioester reductase-like protein